MPLNKVFLDSAYVIALAVPKDQYHQQAVQLANQIKQAGTQIVTTQAILLEIGNALARLRYRPAAMALLQALSEDPQVEIIPLSDALYQQGVALYIARPYKEWSVTDCISFVVMQEQGIMDALTTDGHFQQAGFQVLLH